MTLAQVTGPTPDALLGAVQKWTVILARRFDKAVLKALYSDAAAHQEDLNAAAANPADTVSKLIDGRGALEGGGYRAPSCLIAGNAHFRLLNTLVDGALIVDDLLRAANVNSLYRATQVDKGGRDRMLMLGRRQNIPHGGAATASPGEEPVDLAVSVPPSLEVVGDNLAGQIELAVRVRFATRIKDPAGLVVFRAP
jgi:hypothetical protein